MKLSGSGLIITLSICFFSAAEAQTGQKTGLLSESNIRTVNAGPLGLDTTTPARGGLQLSFVDGKGQASISFGGSIYANQESPFGSISIPLSIKISAPISNTSTTTSMNTPVGSGLDSIATSNQLPNGFDISGKLGFFSVSKVTAGYLDDVAKNGNLEVDFCEKNLGKKLQDKEKVPGKDFSYNCFHSAALANDGYGSDSQFNPFFTGAILPAVQYTTATYYSTKNLAKINSNHFLPSVSAYLSVGAFSFSNVVAAQDESWNIGTVGFDYAGTYKNNPVKVECLNKGGAAILSCVNGSVGAPTSKVSEVGSLQLSFGRDMGDGGYNLFGTKITNWVFVPKFSHDAKTGGSAVDLPFYFLTGAAVAPASATPGIGGVIPGIDASWNSLSHNFIIGVFVTSSFDAMTGGPSQQAGTPNTPNPGS